MLIKLLSVIIVHCNAGKMVNIGRFEDDRVAAHVGPAQLRPAPPPAPRGRQAAHPLTGDR